jgi:ABC-type branched-subunit amino acid transport system substrate-binding protein
MILALTGLSAVSERVREPGVTDTEIRIGNLMPYSGNLALFGDIGKAEAAYFDVINERGGINGRKVRFISYDDKSNPVTALDLTRGLIEKDNVLFLFGSFGTPGNFAVRQYLNDRQIPQLFVASGDDHLFDPSLFPWTMGWQPSFREEGRIYANYIQASYPGRKIVALWQNDQVGREVFKGLQDGLGDVARMIRVDIAYDAADEHLDTHLSILKRSGAEIFVFAGAPANAAKVIRMAAELNWHPVFILSHMASSIATALKPAGPENAAGVITAGFLKDANDLSWEDEQAAKSWQAFMDKYNRAGGRDDGAAVFGYEAAETLVKVLNQCGDDLSRENVMKQAAALTDYQGSVLLPGIKISTGRWNFRPIKHLRLVQFDGRTWQPIGDVLETAFSNVDK